VHLVHLLHPLHLALLTGRLLTADGQPAATLRVVVDWSGGRRALGAVDTIAVDATGRFGTLARPAADSITIAVLGPAYYAARVALPAVRTQEEIRIVLVPRRWVIRVGTFAGDTVDVSPAAALRRAPGGSFGRVSFQHVVGWVPSSYPLSVVLRRDDGMRISAADSIAFWSAARALERDIGGDFFRPAMDTALRGRAYPVDVRIDARIPGAGLTFVSWDREGNIFEASVRFHSSRDMQEPGTVEHELLHVLGFGHTEAWTTAMRARSTSPPRVTSTDVAYAQLLMAVHVLEQDDRVVAGLASAR
jgi:hypothetical protein